MIQSYYLTCSRVQVVVASRPGRPSMSYTNPDRFEIAESTNPARVSQHPMDVMGSDRHVQMHRMRGGEMISKESRTSI